MNFKNKDLLILGVALIVSVLLVYFVPSPINKYLFLLILPITWYSKKDYLWLAFFFIIMDYPGGLFSGGLRYDQSRLPLYTIVPGVAFTIKELYLILLLIKIIHFPKYRKHKIKNYFKKELLFLAYYLVFLLFISLLLGMSLDSLRNFYKVCINLTIFYSISYIIYSWDELIKFFRIIFPFSIVALLFQIYSLTYNQQFIALLKPDVTSIQGVFNMAGEEGIVERPIEMTNILLICFTGSLILLSYKKYSFNIKYLLFINVISYLSIFFTATRTWFLAFSAAYLLYFIIARKHLSKLVSMVTFALFIFFFLININQTLHTQFSSAWSRIETIGKIVEGDITAGGTIKRYDVRVPRVMEGFWSSTIITGAGFSNHYYKYQDGHVGYHNILLNTGIFGMLLMLFLIFRLFKVPYRLSKTFKTYDSIYFLLRTSVIPLFVLLILNIGTQTIGYTPFGINRYFLIAFSVLVINLSIRLSNEVKLK